jgi:hypothetical protein
MAVGHWGWDHHWQHGRAGTLWDGTEGNEYGGEPALSALIAWSRDNIL